MAITITAKKIDSSIGFYERSKVSSGESSTKKARELKRLSADEKSATIEKKEEKVINKASGGLESEFIQGVVYSLHINLFESSTSGIAHDITIHQALSLGELKKISGHISVAEGADSFYDQAVAHSKLNEHSAAYTSMPTGTVTIANIANMATATNLFPHLEYEFASKTHHSGLTTSSFANYIKNTWLPDNMPDSIAPAADTINIL
jgi:hypothetical protein